jgi:predicted phage tail protein
MFNYVLSFILLGLGIQSPVVNPNVKGVSTVSITNDHIATAPAVWASTSAFQLKIQENRQTAAAHLNADHEIFQSKLQIIKDAGKRTLVENIESRLTDINTNRTDTMTKQLAVMSDILDRVSSKAADVASTGKDVSSVTSAVAAARTAIEAAQAAVARQAGKTYSITITTENTLKNNVLTVRKALETDVLATYQKIVLARKAVYNAIRALAVVRGEPIPEVITK